MPDKAFKILSGLRRSQNNCTRHDLEVIYEANGFRIRIGGKHDMAIHTEYKQLRGTLPNHSSFAKSYVTRAIELIDEAIRLSGQKGDKNNE